jgi:ATP/maltotriose-dependent transcriptional regulator MalT
VSRTLLADQQRFDSAFDALDKAISIYRRLGQRDEEARVQMVKGMHLGNAGFPDKAVKHLRLGLKLVDARENPRLELVGKHNLIDNLYRSGRYHQALAMVPETRELHRRLGNPTDLAKFQWLEALIARESGESERAEETFLKIKAFFLDKGWPHEVALVSLDLSALLLRQGRSKELQELASEMLVIFQGLRIHREAIAALVLFQKAVQMERATVGLVRDLAAYLKNSRNNPHLPFRPSANA